MDFKDLEELIKIFEKSGLTEIEIEEEGRRMRLQKSAPAPIAVAVPAVQTPVAAEPQAPEEDALEEGLITIDSPMVGTFYVAPAPGEDPFVKPGDTVQEGDTVCIVEAMKLMNEVAAKVACVIEQVLIEDAQPVEFGQPLFVVRPS